MINITDSGVLKIKCPSPVIITTERIKTKLRDKGFTVFMHLDQQIVAHSVGMEMPSTQVLLFGNPKVGTQLMNEYPSIALELPMKLIIQEGDHDSSVISLNSPAYIAQRHDIDKPVFNGLDKLLLEAVDGKIL